MELSCGNPSFNLARSVCGFSNVPERPSFLRVAMVQGSSKVHAFQRLRAVVTTDCGSCGAELMEMEEWIEMLKWGDKCRGSSSGVVELLECLEREAIMGEDEGRDAVDYNRRAQIFDKSGRVFQALKHQAEDNVVEEVNDDIHSQD